MASVVLAEGNPHVIAGKETASQTFDKGDLVYFDTSGTVAVATAGAINAIAMKDASGTTNATIPIDLIDPNNTYIANYKSASATQTLAGDILDFTFTIGAHTLDESGATTDVYCVGLADPGDATSARLLVKFLGALMTGAGT